MTLGAYRFRLRMIRPGDPVYVIGQFSSQVAGDGGGTPRHSLSAPRSGQGQPFVLSSLSQDELTRLGRRRMLPWLAFFVVLWSFLGLVLIRYW